MFKQVTGQKIDLFERPKSGPQAPNKLKLMMELLNAVAQDVSNYSPTMDERVSSLEEEVRRLKQRIDEKPYAPTAADILYESKREELERDHFGEIVAIDAEAGIIAGIGRNILEAYENASKKSKKSKFAFRKVGSQSICKLR